MLAIVLAVAFLRPHSSATSFNANDVMFAQMMLPHHQQAIVMAEMVQQPGREASADVRSLAKEIRTQQSTEVRTLEELLRSWHADADGGHHVGMMEGVLSDEELRQLDALRGPEFDHAWSLSMIRHHRGAIAMARDVLTSGVNQRVLRLANDVVAAQESEIRLLHAIANAIAN